MLADVLIGLSLWMAASVVAAFALGRVIQRGKLQAMRDHQVADSHHPLSHVA